MSRQSTASVNPFQEDTATLFAARWLHQLEQTNDDVSQLFWEKKNSSKACKPPTMLVGVNGLKTLLEDGYM
ncbi:hypothetical protein GDO86_013652 [Hymenochirus boettgeri]|uniref:Uncharacterized protein n=1 Tax=Hymenochirus boettgeri TaxID=247094 RepID=A0A8T2IXN8_9PIPI|nr:hypothetical protein GDO86_013652 [Hymenochirus boettgeri]